MKYSILIIALLIFTLLPLDAVAVEVDYSLGVSAFYTQFFLVDDDLSFLGPNLISSDTYHSSNLAYEQGSVLQEDVFVTVALEPTLFFGLGMVYFPIGFMHIDGDIGNDSVFFRIFDYSIDMARIGIGGGAQIPIGPLYISAKGSIDFFAGNLSFDYYYADYDDNGNLISRGFKTESNAIGWGFAISMYNGLRYYFKPKDAQLDKWDTPKGFYLGAGVRCDIIYNEFFSEVFKTGILGEGNSNFSYSPWGFELDFGFGFQ